MMTVPRLLMLILVAVLASACGKKGALYLPDQPPPPAQEQPQSK